MLNKIVLTRILFANTFDVCCVNMFIGYCFEKMLHLFCCFVMSSVNMWVVVTILFTIFRYQLVKSYMSMFFF